MTAVRANARLRFGRFELDPIDELVLRGRQRVPLTPKAFAVLRHLVVNSGRRVTKEELLEAIWPGVYVSDAALKVCIREIRKALADDARRPHFIRTDHRRGYSFVAAVAEMTIQTAEESDARSAPPAQPGLRARRSIEERSGSPETRHTQGARGSRPSLVGPPNRRAVSRGAPAEPARPERWGAWEALSRPPISLFGRETEFLTMHAALARARRGERQVLFITGEPGIGKTTLIDAFLAQAARARGPWIARGQCLEHYGAGEPYRPVLEALNALGRGPVGERLVAVLARHAPTWLVQMPSLATAASTPGLARETLGATRERMLREMADALEALTTETPLILVLEDLHWSDFATLDLVSLVAQRRAPARLMLLLTYRPVDVATSGHPLRTVKQELATRRSCEELSLGLLTEAAVAEFLAWRLEGRPVAESVTRLVHQRTEGHPLFMVNVVDFLIGQRLMVETSEGWELSADQEALALVVPDSIRHMIDQQIDSLSAEDVRLLEASSVAGVEFSAAAVAGALKADIIQVEERCEAMARRELVLRRRGTDEWPDGTVVARYEFIHSLYQNVLYQRTASSRRVLLHRAIGKREEAAWGEDARMIAAELAAHFEAGRDVLRALKYLRAAAKNAGGRYANREAIHDLTRAQGLAARLPEPLRPTTEMALREKLGMLRRSMGQARRAAEDFRAVAQCAREQGHSDTEAKALFYLASSLSSIDGAECLAAAGQAVELSRQVEDELLRARTRGSSGYWHSFLRGWRREDAHACAEALAAARRADDPALLSLLLGRYAYFQILESAYRNACATAEEGMRLALDVGDAYEYLFSVYYRALGLLYLGKWGEMLSLVQDAIRMAERNGGAMWVVLFRLQLAWLRTEAGDPEGARPLCESALEQARAAAYTYGQLLSLILLGSAELACGDGKRAFSAFSAVTAWTEPERSSMDWTLQMPLAHGLSQYWLGQGTLDRARAEAMALADQAGQSGERTWSALARSTLAEVAVAGEAWGAADVEMSQALAAVPGGDTPLAKWRVHAAAARVCDRLGRTSEARDHRARSQAIIRALANSLGGSPPGW